MKGLLERFIPEARDLIDSSSNCLLKLEKAPDDGDAVNEVFRAVHTLKGSSGLFDVPALTRLVHAAEDLLGAVRSEDLAINSEHIDQLLAALDQVSVWIDHLENGAHLPDDADRISAVMAKRIRGSFESDQPKPPLIEAVTSRPCASAEDLSVFSDSERLDAFLRASAGDTIIHLRYRPTADCFFNGTDPLSLVLATPGLLATVISTVEPLAPIDSLDPYRCLLAFDLLAAAPIDAIDHHFCYEIDRAVAAAVDPRDLVRIVGRPSSSPVFADFHADAVGLLATDDLKTLTSRACLLVDTMGADLVAVSALKWLIASLTAKQLDRALVAGLVDAVEIGTFEIGTVDQPDARAAIVLSDAPDATAPEPEADESKAETSRALDIVSTQLRRLKGQPFERQCVIGIRSIIGNVALSLGDEQMATAIEAAAAAADTDETYGALEAALSAMAARLAGDDTPKIAIGQVAAAAMAADPVEPVAETIATRPAELEAKRPAQRALKVDQAKIDELMNLIGELAVSKNSLPFLAKRAEDVFGSRELGREIKEQYAVIDRLAQDLQAAIMQVRMLPISDVFDRFPRLVRDLSRKLSKDIELVIDGGDTAADKNIIEALNDPLLHVVRNSLDHGVELPEVRVAAGKSPRATISLRAYQEADHVVIEVRDDGRGIDPVKIRAAAIAKGVIDEAEADRLTDQEAINLIFRPGFSTAEKVSDLSGRGVGMDVVRTVVEKLGGRASVTSRVGEGSVTQLMLPLSMAVTRIMIIEAASGQYGVPMDLIVETVRVEADRIHKIQHSEAFILRSQLIPLVRIANLLNEPARPLVHDAEAVLVCRVGGRVVGLIIDDFKVGMDVIVKPLDGIVANMRGFSGTTLLGDGRVLLVLDLKELI